MKILRGFTLSEMIVTLAVVGIIAAITVPGLVQHYQRDTQVTMLKKAYMNLQDNLTMLQTENVGADLYHSTLGDVNAPDVAGFVNRYYNVKQSCGDSYQPCFAELYKNIAKSSGNLTHAAGSAHCYAALLSDGSAIDICPAASSTNTPARVHIDVNGPDKPNVAGRDLFNFNIYEDFSIDVVPPETIAAGTAREERESLFNNACYYSIEGTGCLGKILNDNWKMNY